VSLESLLNQLRNLIAAKPLEIDQPFRLSSIGFRYWRLRRWLGPHRHPDCDIALTRCSALLRAIW
jgi:hypothetical protein